jgi:hypothetical protein
MPRAAPASSGALFDARDAPLLTARRAQRGCCSRAWPALVCCRHGWRCQRPGGAEDAALRQQVGVPGGGRHARGTPLERTARAAGAGRALATRARGDRLPGLRRHRRADQLQRPGAPVLPAQRPRCRATCRSTWSTSTTASARATRSPRACARAAGHRQTPWRQREGGGSAARPAGAVADRGRGLRPRLRRPRDGARVRGPFEPPRHRRRRRQRWIADAPRELLLVDRVQARRAGRAAAGHREARCAPAWRATPPTCTTMAEQVSAPGARCAAAQEQADLDALLALRCAAASGASWCRCRSWCAS